MVATKKSKAKDKYQCKYKILSLNNFQFTQLIFQIFRTCLHLHIVCVNNLIISDHLLSQMLAFHLLIFFIVNLKVILLINVITINYLDYLHIIFPNHNFNLRSHLHNHQILHLFFRILLHLLQCAHQLT